MFLAPAQELVQFTLQHLKPVRIISRRRNPRKVTKQLVSFVRRTPALVSLHAIRLASQETPSTAPILQNIIGHVGVGRKLH